MKPSNEQGKQTCQCLLSLHTRNVRFFEKSRRAAKNVLFQCHNSRMRMRPVMIDLLPVDFIDS